MVLDGKQRFWRNFRKLAGANVAALVIMVGLAPLLGWIYPPEAFGYLAYFMFAFQMLTSISICRFDWLMPNAKTMTEELGLLVWGVAALLITSTAAALLFIFPPAILTQWEGYEALGSFLVLVPLAAIGMGLRLLLSARYIRIGDLGPVSLVKVIETLANAGGSIVLGLAGLVVAGLVWARVISSWIGIGRLLKKAPITRAQLRRLSRLRLKVILRRHLWSSARSTFVSFFNTLSTNAPILVLSSVATTIELGLFFMATRLISTPIQLGAKALSQSFWARSAELARLNQYRDLRHEYTSLVLRLTLIAGGIVAVLIGVGLIIEDFFPPEWEGLGATFIAFSPMILGIVAVGSCNHLIVFDKPQYQLVADGTRLVLMCISVFALANAGTPFWGLVLAVSVSSLAGHIILFAMHMLAYSQAIAAQPGIKDAP